MAYAVALDGTKMLPPFVPVGRNEDGLFGRTLRLSDGRALIAQVPECVGHDSRRMSRYTSGRRLSVGPMRSSDAMLLLFKQLARPSERTEPSLAALSRVCHDVATLRPSDFDGILKSAVTTARWKMASRCEELLHSGYRYPPYWRRELAEMRASILAELERPFYHWPHEWASIDDFQCHIRRFGQLLEIWPEMWRYCEVERPFD